MKVIKMAKETEQLFGLHFFSSTSDELLAELADKLHTKSRAAIKPLVLFTPNPEQVVLAHQRPQFHKILKHADYLLPDGMGIIWASRIFAVVAKLRGKHFQVLPQRIAGSDFVKMLLAKYRNENVLLVGGRGYKSASLKVEQTEVAWFSGYQSATTSKEDEQKIRLALRKLKPLIVFVAFGAPDQEEWIVNHLTLLQQEGVRLVMAVGGSFDILTGKLKRAPTGWQRLGLEWLFRLIQEPWRWRRQMRLLSFMGLTVGEAGKTLFH